MLPALLIVASVQANQVPMTAEQDHQRLLKMLGIEPLRPGINGMDPKAPNFANTDEAKAKPVPKNPRSPSLQRRQRSKNR